MALLRALQLGHDILAALLFDDKADLVTHL
jgi:hypothetical protein